MIILTKDMMGPPSPYFCIHCCHSAPQVYKTYASGNLVKLLQCKGCGEFIDKYVEYDPIIVAINLVLQNPMAYRHILLNTAFGIYWKLGVVFLFCEAYCFWCFQKGVEIEADSADFYELEINFYRVLLRTLFSSFLFHFYILLASYLYKKWNSGKVLEQFSYLTIWKGLCLAGFAEIFELVALIWSYSNDQSRLLFVSCLFVFTNTQCFNVTTGVHQLKSFLIVSCCFLLRKQSLQYYDELITT